MPLVCVWEKMALDREDGSTLILNRGQALPEWVDDFHRSVFTMIGAVKDNGAAVTVIERAAEDEFAEQPAPPVLPAEVPPVQPANPLTNVDPVATEPAVNVPEAGTLTKPSASDNKDAWETYAAARGYMSQTEAESLTKRELMAEVNRRESAA